MRTVEAIRRIPSILPLMALAAGVSGACGGRADLRQSSDDAGGGGRGNTSVTACNVPSDCVVIPKSCCGSCGAPTPEDSLAVNRTKIEQARDCGEIGCPECEPNAAPPLVATCDGGTCKVVDLTRDASTSCTSESDCHLRVRECCECGGDTSPLAILAISDLNRYGNLVCDPGVGCDDCAPSYPENVGVMCNEGRCSVIRFALR